MSCLGSLFGSTDLGFIRFGFGDLQLVKNNPKVCHTQGVCDAGGTR